MGGTRSRYSGLIEITEALLVKLAGPGAYERGLNYFAEGRVTAIESTERRTSALVHGTELYTVQLAHSDRQLDGACDCPASEGIDFCKHCVALALVLQARQINGSLLEHGNDDEKLEAYLTLQTPAALVAELMSASRKLPELRERMLLQAELVTDFAPAKRLKKAITKVTRPRPLWEYSQVAAYFARIEATLDNIGAVASQIAPNVLLRTVLYAITRIEKALEQIDDSGGYRYGAYERLQQLHVEALRRLDWSTDRKAEHLLNFALDSDSDQFPDVPQSFAEALGDEGLEAFYSQVQARLNAMPKLRSGASFNAKYPYLHLSVYLKERAALAEDWDALIELEKVTATNEREYRHIADLCLRKLDAEAAAAWLAKADAIDGGNDIRAAWLWSQVHIAREDWQAAVEAQQQVFWHEPEYESFGELLGVADRAGCVDSVRAAVKAKLGEPVKRPWQAARHAFTLAMILRDEQDWEGSFQALVGRVSDPERLREAARWLSDPAPQRASELYALAIEALIAKKNKRGYRDAVKVIVEAKPSYDAVGRDEFASFVARLRDQHKQKRNFLAALDASL